MFRSLAAALALTATPAVADTDRFVQSNLLAIFYHELGHAIIDTMELPVFGQEEDAADVASILLIDELFEEEDAVAMAYDAAFGFLAEAEQSEGEEPAWWDVHGADLQRYYNTVCIFVGADLEGRDDIAAELELPDERLDTCEEEYDLAIASWGGVFDEMAELAPSDSLVYSGDEDTPTEQLVAAEVAELNAVFGLPVEVAVRVEACGEPNAFYDPNEVAIIMCEEFADWLAELAPE